MAEEQENSIVDLKKYLGTPERPVSMQEMNEFWGSLTDEEKKEFRSTPLPKEE
jgi:predicted metal-dependent hydrolase